MSLGKLDFVMDYGVLCSISRTRRHSPERNRSLKLQIPVGLGLWGLLLYNCWTHDRALFYPLLAVVVGLHLVVGVMLRYFWDPFYVIKARNWRGIRSTYEVVGDSIVHSWNGDVVEIPVGSCTQIIDPGEGLILVFGKQEIVLPQILPAAEVQAFKTALQAAGAG